MIKPKPDKCENCQKRAPIYRGAPLVGLSRRWLCLECFQTGLKDIRGIVNRALSLWTPPTPQADIEAIRKRAAEQARYPWAPPLGQIFKDDIPALLDYIYEFEEQIADWHDWGELDLAAILDPENLPEKAFEAADAAYGSEYEHWGGDEPLADGLRQTLALAAAIRAFLESYAEHLETPDADSY